MLRLLRPLDVYSFRMFFIPLLVVLLLINLVFFSFLNGPSLHWKELALLAGINFLLQLILIPVIFKRVLYVIDGKWRVMTSLSVFLVSMVFPLFSLFICVLCLKDTDYKKFSSRRILWHPLGLSLCLVLISLISLGRDSAIVKIQMGSTANYVSNVLIDFGTVLYFKNKKESQCIEALNTKCVVDWYFKSESRSTNTGIILATAVDALVLFKIKKEMKKHTQNKKALSKKIALELIDNNTYYLKENNCRRIEPFALSNPIDFMTGMGSTYIFQAFDEKASKQFNRAAGSKLGEILDSIPRERKSENKRDIASLKTKLESLNGGGCPPRPFKS